MGGNGANSHKVSGSANPTGSSVYMNATESTILNTTKIGESLNKEGFLSSLSKAEKQAVNDYSENAYNSVNRYLRSSRDLKSITPKNKKTMNTLSKVLDKHTLTQNVITHRGA